METRETREITTGFDFAAGGQTKKCETYRLATGTAQQRHYELAIRKQHRKCCCQGNNQSEIIAPNVCMYVYTRARVHT